MKFFNNGKTIINYEDYGCQNNEVICFSNSLGTDSRIWHKIIDYFKNDYRIIIYDKRGHGLSNKPATNLTIEDLAFDVSDLLDHLEIKNVNFVGISIGGMIAQKLASIKPNIINKLILCDTAVKIGNSDIWNDRINLVKKQGIRGISDSIISRWFSEDFISKNKD
ncbi:MAG: alpha/beta fold hydrolase, partial [Pseudomonadota bacterium]|nr:alpha/beta fold hydrolase [Pseudomonadota bacterium]